MKRDHERITREDLYELVWREPMLKVAERYGVSSSFMARVCHGICWALFAKRSARCSTVPIYRCWGGWEVPASAGSPSRLKLFSQVSRWRRYAAPKPPRVFAGWILPSRKPAYQGRANLNAAVK